MKQDTTGMDESLYAKYPKLLRQYKLGCKETCLCWGIVPGPGWEGLVSDMLAELEAHRVSKDPKLELSQVKEKFALLRVYYDNAKDDEAVDEIIGKAESMSAKTCIECGKPGRLRNKSWLRIACDECDKKRRGEI